MKRFALVGLLATLVGVAAVTLMVFAGRGSHGVPDDATEPGRLLERRLRRWNTLGGRPSGTVSVIPKPEPTLTTAEFQSEPVGEYRYRVWPRSENVPNEGVYRFSAPHCGLEWMTDFDGSFWKITDRKSYGKHGPSFFINSDQGTLNFEAEDLIVYRASTGKEVRLRRLPGPTVIHLCD